jgi:hypothetical protein
LASILAAVLFFIFIAMPYELRYFALGFDVILLVLLIWWGLMIKKGVSMLIRLMTIFLPVGFFIGYGLFTAIIPYNFIAGLIESIFLGIFIYIIFLVQNVFLFAVGYKTVPLYRAAYTVGSILMLLTTFFLFDSLFSFNLSYWLNMIFVFAICMLVFAYHFFSVSIELTDDGKNLDIRSYIVVPSFIMSQLALVFSFWPVGIFKGSIYLTAIIYIIAGLIQSDIRGRLFKRTILSFLWIGVAVVLGIILMTGWR